MQLKNALLLASFLVARLLCNAQKQGDRSAIADAQAWWHAITFGDTSYVKTHSTAQLTVTFNSGRSFNYAEIIKQIAGYDPKAPIKAEWSQMVQQSPTSTTAIVTNRGDGRKDTSCL